MDHINEDDKQRLIRAAFEAKQFSYSAYSRFRVGAALLSTSGEIIKGTNVENASFGGTICAERTAIVKAVSDGIRQFQALSITTDLPYPASPCGICRQALREFCDLQMPVLLVPGNYFDNGEVPDSEKDSVIIMTVGELLPRGFGPENLPKND